MVIWVWDKDDYTPMAAAEDCAPDRYFLAFLLSRNANPIDGLINIEPVRLFIKSMISTPFSPCLAPLQPCHPVACVLRPAIKGPTSQALSPCWVLATSILVLYNTSCRHDAASSCRSESSHAICITSLATLQLSAVLCDEFIGWAFTQDLNTALQR